MPKFAVKLALILFEKYKNKSKIQGPPSIKMYNYLLVQSHSEKQWHFLVHMRYTGVSMKRNQFPLIVFIGIGDLIVIPIGILEKTKTLNQTPILYLKGRSYLALLHLKTLLQQLFLHLKSSFFIQMLLQTAILPHLKMFDFH